MSNLASNTEKKAVMALSRCLKYFDQLSFLNMSAEDAFRARSAENQIKSIIETNGFRVIYTPGKGRRIEKRLNQSAEGKGPIEQNIR
jgi:hypothetical protein